MNKKKYLLDLIRLYRNNIVLPTTTIGKDKRVMVILFPFKDLGAGYLVEGNTGSGKTNVIKIVVYQLPRRPEDTMVFFDPKHEYYEEFYREGDIVIGLSGSTHSWNIFLEVESESDFDELGAELFAESEKDFWANSAQQLFSAILKLIYRESKKQNVQATNADLVKFMQSKESREIYELLRDYEDLRSAAQYISPQAEKQAIGVISTLHTKFNQTFIADFARSDKPVFSVREYMRNPNNRTVFFLFDVTKAKTIVPIYRLLIDAVAKYSIQPGSEWHRKFLIIDEAQFLPHLQLYDALVNTGRSYGAFTLTGLQSIAQLNAAYGKNVADALLSGNWYAVLLRQNDPQSVKFVRDAIGRRQYWQTTHHGVPTPFGGYEIEERKDLTEYCPISEEEILKWEAGRGVIITPTKWYYTKLLKYSEAKVHVDEVDNQIEWLSEKYKKWLDKQRRKL